MEKLNDFETVLYALRNDQVVMIQSPVLTNFSLKEDRIFVKSDNLQYFLSFDEFEQLFKHSIFFYYERKQSFEIETLKDDEYYAWKHK